MTEPTGRTSLADSGLNERGLTGCEWRSLMRVHRGRSHFFNKCRLADELSWDRWASFWSLLMRIFKSRPSPVSDEDVAAAARLRKITARREEASLPADNCNEQLPIEAQRRVFWTPAELLVVGAQ